MSPYLLTLAFLTVMSCFTASQVAHFSESTAQTNLFHSSLSQKRTHEKLIAFGHIEDRQLEQKETNSSPPSERTETSEPSPPKENDHPSSLRFNLSRPPNNSRINFYPILFMTDEEQPYPLDLSPREFAARLMRLLYADAPFYQHDLEYQILDQLCEHKEKATGFCYPDELAEIVFDHPVLQQKFYLMLKGTETTPSLLDFITFDKDTTKESKKINLMFASEVVLKALFLDHPGAVPEFLSLRNGLLKRMIDQEKNRLEMRKDTGKGRKAFKEELKTGVEKIVASVGLEGDEAHQALDYSLGKYGTILFVDDPSSGLIKREKYRKREITPLAPLAPEE